MFEHRGFECKSFKADSMSSKEYLFLLKRNGIGLISIYEKVNRIINRK